MISSTFRKNQYPFWNFSELTQNDILTYFWVLKNHKRPSDNFKLKYFKNSKITTKFTQNSILLRKKQQTFNYSQIKP